jgi:hypothetical protein
MEICHMRMCVSERDKEKREGNLSNSCVWVKGSVLYVRGRESVPVFVSVCKRERERETFLCAPQRRS